MFLYKNFDVKFLFFSSEYNALFEMYNAIKKMQYTVW